MRMTEKRLQEHLEDWTSRIFGDVVRELEAEIRASWKERDELKAENVELREAWEDALAITDQSEEANKKLREQVEGLRRKFCKIPGKVIREYIEDKEIIALGTKE